MMFESSLKNKTTKFQSLHENFYKEKATSLQPLQGHVYLAINITSSISSVFVPTCGTAKSGLFGYIIQVESGVAGTTV
ncbi:hypothetical protein P8452_61856 [Trifolium repens]|nr:hypothetical protein P8452_61856 [Trifolium repens]